MIDADHALRPAAFRNLPSQFYAEIPLSPVAAPAWVWRNTRLMAQWGLDPAAWSGDDALAMLAGNALPDNSPAIATAYAGHQYANWVPLLGDGRALLLGDIADGNGTLHEVQLKGSGPTPFSRMGDGRATLPAMLREVLVSEAMAGLGIPTTRSLAVVGTGEKIIRERFEDGAVLTRLARSHIRVGSFQFAASQDSENAQLVRALADHAIARLYPALTETPDPYGDFLDTVVLDQAELIARWMLIGFVHGVMNSDNMTISGETIDYGPCAFLDSFIPGKSFSSIDRGGRYAWSNQPTIGLWNLTRLAESLLPLLGSDETSQIERAKRALDRFVPTFEDAFAAGLHAKLGLVDGPQTAEFVQKTLAMMASERLDFTLFFRRLTQVAGGQDAVALLSLSPQSDVLKQWLSDWRNLAAISQESLAAMRAANPVIIARNHQVEKALQAANTGDLAPFERLVKALADPFTDRADIADLEVPPEPQEEVTQTFCGT